LAPGPRTPLELPPPKLGISIVAGHYINASAIQFLAFNSQNTSNIIRVRQLDVIKYNLAMQR
jgi:hypothetical protein